MNCTKWTFRQATFQQCIELEVANLNSLYNLGQSDKQEDWRSDCNARCQNHLHQRLVRNSFSWAKVNYKPAVKSK